MKLSPTLCVSVMALAAFALTANGAFASISLNSSRSNVYRIAQGDPNGEKACTDKGGKVSTDKDGNKICTLPAPAPASAPASAPAPNGN